MDGSRTSEQNDSSIADDDNFKIKGAATGISSNNVPRNNVAESCSICLDPITERAVAVPCNHLAFDFICLVSWLQQRDTCPLCNATVTAVEYDWSSPSDHETYHVERAQIRQTRSRDVNQSRASWQLENGSPNSTARNRQPRKQHDSALEGRREVYRLGLFSQHIGVNPVSQYHDFTPQDFAVSAILQSQTRTFLRRELQAFASLEHGGSIRNRDFTLEYVVAVLKKFSPKGADGRAENLLSEFFGTANARLLLHELQAWLRSPFATLEQWDQEVQY